VNTITVTGSLLADGLDQPHAVDAGILRSVRKML